MAAEQMEFVVGDAIGMMARSGRRAYNSSFSPMDLNTVAKAMSDEEMNYVRQIGLAGLLKVDFFSHFSRDFSHFMYQLVDPVSRTLVLGNNRSYPIDEQTMARVLGVRAGGSVEVQHYRGPATPEEVEGARQVLQLDGFGEITTPGLIAILLEKRVGELSEAEANRVKLAYAMLAISVFFSPREKRGFVPRDAYRIALNIPRLHMLNWVRYVVDESVDGAWKLQECGRRNISGFTIFGPQLALPCMYFDGVETGFHGVDKRLEPRIEHYTASVLKALIVLDTKFLPGMKVYGMFMRVPSRDALKRLPGCASRGPRSKM